MTFAGRTTGEYNPICGSDNNTYHNPARLTCAQECGASKYQLIEIEIVFMVISGDDVTEIPV